MAQQSDIPPFQGESNPPFPEQLFQLLHNAELVEHVSDAIYWLRENDNVFAINKRIFSEKLLKSHFRGKFALGEIRQDWGPPTFNIYVSNEILFFWFYL